uniref:Protein TonB n=1 Tax=Candidatus Kentrum eta TaxID=2126337 RepID=A0A450UNW6_9GAMM|nr:MAG: protein TonB [Candidatus Kentron sp. H]VFJ95006.1 MAG: protein TonB [Candidatus Kentron sp. H]VFK01488.1 MAG: protein TonB [Candidatus Kentron sp. H]
MAMVLSVVIHSGVMAIAGRMPPPAPSAPGLPARDTLGVRLISEKKAPPAPTAALPRQKEDTRPKARLDLARHQAPPQPEKRPPGKTAPRKPATATPNKPFTPRVFTPRVSKAPSPDHRAPKGKPARPVEGAPPTETASTPNGSMGSPGIETPAKKRPSPDTAILSRIMARLGRLLVYPRRARRRGWEGETLVTFELVDNQRIERIRIARSSGYRVLDRAALEALGRIKPIPEGKRGTVSHNREVTIPVVFRLTE